MFLKFGSIQYDISSTQKVSKKQSRKNQDRKVKTVCIIIVCFAWVYFILSKYFERQHSKIPVLLNTLPLEAISGHNLSQHSNVVKSILPAKRPQIAVHTLSKEPFMQTSHHLGVRACPSLEDVQSFKRKCTQIYKKPGPDYLCPHLQLPTTHSPWLSEIDHAWSLPSDAKACPAYSTHLEHRPRRFQDHEFQCYSQTSEDGILLFLLLAFGSTSRRGIEIAGGLGWENNVINLVVNFGFSALFFDGDPGNSACARNFLQAHPTTSARFNHNIFWSSDFVTKNNFNELIANITGWSGDIDVLSIDIDGMDFWIWEALAIVSPRIVVVEIQELWGPELRRTRPYDAHYTAHGPNRIAQMGASLAAFRELARRRGYRLAGCMALGFNAFFVRNDLPGVDIVLGAQEYDARGCFGHVDSQWEKVLRSRREQAQQYTWIDPF